MSRSRSPSPKFTSKWGQKPNAPNGVVKMTPNGEGELYIQYCSGPYP